MAGIVYLWRRRPGKWLEQPLELSAEEIDRKSARGWAQELPVENKVGELRAQRGPRAELFEIREPRLEMG